ncbi:hypothetical protein QZH41_014867, partial [Actinostola sp. cb2023]
MTLSGSARVISARQKGILGNMPGTPGKKREKQTKMAGRQTGKFLSPAHFETIPSKSNAKTRKDDEGRKLLPPGVYEKVKSPSRDKLIVVEQKQLLSESKEDLKKAKTEINSLRDEVHGLKEHLEKSKERDLELREERNQLKQKYTYRGEEDSVSWRRFVEVEDENTALLSETRKQQTVITKLRNDIKQIKRNYEAEIEKLDCEVAKYSPVVRQLKQELKDKDLKSENELENVREMLIKQTANVKELELELHKAHKQIQVDRSGFEDVMSQHEAHKYQDLKSLREALKGYKAKYLRDVGELNECMKEKEKMIEIIQTDLNTKQMEIKKLNEDNEQNEREFVDKMNQCKLEIELSQERFESTSNELQLALQEAINSHNRALEDFKEKLHRKDRQIKQEQSTIEQLRVYIGDNLPNIQQERLQNENERLKEKLEILMKENGNVNSTIQFMKIRLTSLSEILSLQENELHKSLLARQNGAENVLTKWREKVFALLVQLKSQEICKESDEKDCKHMVSALHEELETLRHEFDILSHTLADRNAELQIQVNLMESLQEELTERKATEEHLVSTLTKYQDAVTTLHGNALNMVPFIKELCSNMNEAFARLGSLSQRVSFATGRVEFLQALVANILMKANVQDHEISIFLHIVGESDETHPASCQELFNEIDRLTQERDMLTAQALKAAELLECRVANVRAEYNDRVKESSSKIEQLDTELRDERGRCSAFADKLETLETDLQESNETVENLELDLARHTSGTEK